MLRGEFIRGDGLVIPNNITQFGARTILAAALCNIAPTFFVGLVDAQPDPQLLIADVIEPSFTNGYERIEIERSSVGWPTEGSLNGETWFESGFLIWEAEPAAFDVPVRRLMLVQNATNVVDDVTDSNLKVLALSGAMPSDLIIRSDTLEANRTFKYRIYLR